MKIENNKITFDAKNGGSATFPIGLFYTDVPEEVLENEFNKGSEDISDEK